MELLMIRHRSGEMFKVRKDDLDVDLPDEDLIPLFEINGTRRSRADAFMGSGRPSDGMRKDAREGIERAKNEPQS